MFLLPDDPWWEDWDGPQEPMGWKLVGPMACFLERIFLGRSEWWVGYVPVVIPQNGDKK